MQNNYILRDQTSIQTQTTNQRWLLHLHHLKDCVDSGLWQRLLTSCRVGIVKWWLLQKLLSFFYIFLLLWLTVLAYSASHCKLHYSVCFSIFSRIEVYNWSFMSPRELQFIKVLARDPSTCLSDGQITFWTGKIDKFLTKMWYLKNIEKVLQT